MKCITTVDSVHDRCRVNSRTSEYVNIYKRDNLQRGAVVPYILVDNVKYFLLGIDTRTGDITDLGGGVWKKESIIQGAFREFHEESLGLFRDIIDISCTSKCISRDNLNTYFVPLNVDILKLVELCKKFNTMKKIKNEIEKLFLIPETIFKDILCNRFKSGKTKMWALLKKFYNINYTSDLDRELDDLYIHSHLFKNL